MRRSIVSSVLRTKIIYFRTSSPADKLSQIAELFSLIIAFPAFLFGLRPFIESFQRDRTIIQSSGDFIPLFFALAPAILFLIIYTSRKRWRDQITRRFSRTRIAEGALGERIRSGISTSDGGRIDRFGDESGWTDPALNHWILDQSFRRVRLEYRVGAPYYAYMPNGGSSERARLLRSYTLHSTIGGQARIFNDAKIRLSTDLRVGMTGAVTLQKTDYLSSLMTDQLAFIRISDENSGSVLTDGFSSFLDVRNDAEGHFLKPISQAAISNQLGASTIAFTRDGTIVLVLQTLQNTQSQGKLAPSGSGSIDWSDLARQRLRPDFWRLIREGAARELFEECGIGSRIDFDAFCRKDIHLYAYSRMVHRAGKPEFFAIARLPFTSSEIDAMKVSRLERPFTERTQPIDTRSIDPTGDVAAEIVRICTYFSESSNLLRIVSSGVSLSYPLHHGLDLLAEAARDPHHGPRLAAFVAEYLRA